MAKGRSADDDHQLGNKLIFCRYYKFMKYLRNFKNFALINFEWVTAGNVFVVRAVLARPHF
jgi:hypothetical protein